MEENWNFQKLKKINNDTVAWLKVEGTNIESTVVKTSDNNFYLNHNFEKKDKSMFGTLKNILNEEWYENEKNHIIEFITDVCCL